MRTLPFTVEGQTLRKDGDFGGIISGSKGYLRCRLKIADNDWLYAKKVLVFKYKPKKNYRRRQGHRQPYTKVEITKVNA